MAKAYPSDDEVENIGVIGHRPSTGTTLKQGSYTFYNRSLKDRDDAIRHGDKPPCQMGGREKENDTICQSGGTSEGDKTQKRNDDINVTKTHFVVRENYTTSQRKTSSMKSQYIKNSDSDRSQCFYISRKESKQSITRASKDSVKGVKGDASLGKWQTNTTKDATCQTRISNNVKGKLQGDTPFGIRRQQSTGSVHRDIKTERNLNPKKSYSDVRKQYNMSVECILKMKETNGRNIYDVSARSKQTGDMGDKRSPHKHIPMGRSLNTKKKHGHDNFSNRKGQEMKTGDDIHIREGHTLIKKHYGDLHGNFSSETVGTLLKKNNDDHGIHGDISSGSKNGEYRLQCEMSCETMQNNTTTDCDCGIQGDTSRGTRQEMKTTDCATTNTCDISNGKRQEMNTNYVNSDHIFTREKHKGADFNSVNTDKQCKQKEMQTTELNGKQLVKLRKLIELSDFQGDPDSLLLEITDGTDGFEGIFDCNIKPDWLYYILKVLAVVSTSSQHTKTFIDIFLKVEDTFLPGLNTVLGEILIKNKLYSCIWEDADFLCKTCLLILKIVQTLVQTIISSVGNCKHALILIKEIQSLFLLNDETLSIELQNANDIISVTVEEIDHNYRRSLTMSTDCANASAPLGAFRELHILPTIDDIQTHVNPSLSAIRPTGKYENLDLYLDIHFRLLREDFIYPLRQGISEYVQNLYDLTPYKKIREIKIYKNVEIICPTYENEEVSHLIQFDMSNFKGVDMTDCRRLMYGSLLCLSCDNFRNISFATVVKSDIRSLRVGLVEVHFEKVPLTNRSTQFVMIESTSYFEAFRHVLVGLQYVDPSLPFQRYILDCNPVIKPPSYLLGVGVPEYDFTCILPDESQKKKCIKIPVLNTTRWPTSEDLRLDKSQYEALQLALTKELTIIQGPPGTGKTFIGLQITKLLLENKSYWKDSKAGGSSILVICNTNHALDQFLEGILRFCNGSIVRIGSRSKSTALEQYMLMNLKKNGSKSAKTEFYYNMKAIREEQDDRERQVQNLVSAQRKTFTEVQPFTSLVEHMTEKQRKAFGAHITDENLLMTEWLKIQPSPLIHGKDISENESAKLLWIAYISNDVKKMAKHETKRVSDVYNIDLLLRAELYKAWLAEFLTRAHVIISSHNEPKSRKESLKRTLQKTIIYPIDMLNYITSKQTKWQLNQIRYGADFEAWLAIDGSMYSTDDIYLIYCELINDSENTSKEWVWNWNAKYESESITEISKDVRELSDDKATGMTNMWTLPIADRRSLYWHWVCKLRGKLKIDVQLTKETYREMPRAIAKLREQETRDVMRRKNVIGMTTTGAAKHRHLLLSIQPAIVIVEEAAQVLESHIVTALNEKCKHLILIGDHQQLRPSTSVYHLAQKYHLDISLFERMVLNGIPCVTLSEQHRMRPEVSVLLKNEHLYPELRDHTTVFEYENISGVDSDVYFIEHSEAEVHIDDSASKQNPHEAKFTVRLCNYLLKQGYERSQVTVLTPYMGQVTLLKKEMHKLKLDDVHVTAVDNFQGEENDIILLSLVRSSKMVKRKNQIGFLAIANRVCVALSRAKKGFYVIGNFALMKEYSVLWKHNVALMAKTNRIGQEITLRCQNHPTTIIKASTPEDFDNAPEGGCTEPCLTTLKCSHVCPKICHIIDRNHEIVECMEACLLSLPQCGHKCKKKCFEKCDPCPTKVEKEVPFCGHRVYMPCSLDPDDWMCQMNCEFRLQCGHVCCRQCNECKSQDEHEHLCKTLVKKELTCGHAPQELPCYQDPHCTELCRVSLPCGHEADVTCDYKTNFLHKYKCAMRVSKTLLCGHILELPCFKDPSTAKCKESISVTLQCGHVSELLCSQNPHIIMCNTPCGAELSCRHICTGTCGTCFSGKIHHPCEKTCQKSLPCGHKCSHRCGDDCPPCNLPCEWICSHGNKCRKKCSEKCDPCRKKCNYGCIHSSCTKLCYELCDKTQCNKRCVMKLACGHTCTGLCGELCVCSEFCSVKENKIYYRKDKDTVYIKMPACGCIIPQNVLDDYMSRPSFAKDDVLKRCMVCRKVVSSCIQRYSNTIKHTLNAVYQELISMEVSEKISDKRRYKYTLINRVHRLRDIGLEQSDVNTLKARLKNSTFDALNVIDKTIDMLVELLMASKIRLAVPEHGLAIKPSELIKLLLRERKYGTAQFWAEIRNEIKRIGDFRRLKNMHQETVDICSDCDTEIPADTEDDTL